ncbi:MAG: hypothetical protein HYZ53_01705 [Planctomycetes bacterium]|nr:hypothetical protein [Planctomycetota bacterium]
MDSETPTPAADAAAAADLFPSGPWIGFYTYRSLSGRHRMSLALTFHQGVMRGDGSDDIGRFLIHGRYSAETLECRWTKTYPGSHDVAYRGFREGKGIWGTWQIPPSSHGGFLIWPRGVGSGESQVLEAEAPAEAEPAEGEPVGVGTGGGVNAPEERREGPGRGVDESPGA